MKPKDTSVAIIKDEQSIISSRNLNGPSQKENSKLLPENETSPISEFETGKEEISMPQEPVVKMTRKQIYDEIWTISVAGMAKKYDIQYAALLKQIKNADIPIPPSGYWTQLSYGKPVEQPALEGVETEIVCIYNKIPSRKKISEIKIPEPKKKSPLPKENPQPKTVERTDRQLNEIIDLGELETRDHWGHTYNVYDRNTLYQEVWKYPVTELTKKYKVSDVSIHKVCKSLDIPTPPPGYWAKVRAGKPVTIAPLPKSDKSDKKEGARTGVEYTPPDNEEKLAFMPDKEKAAILAVTSQIRLPDDNSRMHSKIISHRKAISEWQKKRNEQIAKGWGMRNQDKPPFLADTIADVTLPRVFRIIDALIKSLEPLECSLTDNLDFLINGETVSLRISESKDQMNHVITKEENLQLLKYEDERRRHSWASKPQIRKYDYPYSGRISVTVYHGKTFRDCKSYVVEDKLGEIILEMYEASDVLCKEREAREEAARKREEEAKIREERRERYNTEVQHTKELINAAEDYETARKIRAYIAAMESSGSLDGNGYELVEWAKKKADWFDPLVSREDEYFGKREHEKDADAKTLKEKHSYW